MARVLISWELGSGFGHLARLEPVASQLRAQGHKILFVVRDTASAIGWLGINQYDLLPAPPSKPLTNLRRPPANYGEMLIAEGYGEPNVALGVIEAWSSIFKLFNPDILVADHSPMALFTARMFDVRRVMIGSGFEIPPLSKPYPCFRPWEKIAKADLESSEKRMLQALKFVTDVYGAKPLSELHNIFDLDWSAITSFEELDHYGYRSDGRYIGPSLSRRKGLRQDWKTNKSEKILVYMQGACREARWVLDILRSMDAEVFVVFPGMKANLAWQMSTENVKVFGELIWIEPLLRDMSMAISHGGVGIVSSLLVAGIPLVLVPQNIEQYMHSCRVEALGAGLVLGDQRDKDLLENLIRMILHDSRYRDGARAFSNKHRDFDSASSVATIVDNINRVLDSGLN